MSPAGNVLRLDRSLATGSAPARTRMARIGAEVAANFAEDVDAAGRFPRETVAALREEKLLSLLVPGELGGAGASLAEVVELCALLGQHCASSAMLFAMHQIQIAILAAHAADNPWHRDFLRRVARDELLIASSTTEAGIGGDLRNSLCAVEADGTGRFSLRKEASVCSYGAEADAIFVTARRNPQAPSSDQVIVLVEREQVRMTRTGTWDAMGLRGTCSEGFVLEVQAGVEQIVPRAFGEGAAQSMLAVTHLVWAGVWYGIASNAFARAQAFLRAEARKKPDGQSPGRIRLAEAQIALQELKTMLQGAVREHETAIAVDGLSSLAFATAMNTLKVGGSRLAFEVVQTALVICGLSGYRNGTPYSLGRHLRDVLSGQVMINNDRILSNTASLLVVQKHDATLWGQA